MMRSRVHVYKMHIFAPHLCDDINKMLFYFLYFLIILPALFCYVCVTRCVLFFLCVYCISQRCIASEFVKKMRKSNCQACATLSVAVSLFLVSFLMLQSMVSYVPITQYERRSESACALMHLLFVQCAAMTIASREKKRIKIKYEIAFEMSVLLVNQ